MPTSWPEDCLLRPANCRQTAKLSTKTSSGAKYEEVALEEGPNVSAHGESLGKNAFLKKSHKQRKPSYYYVMHVAIVFMGLVVMPAIAIAVRCACSPLVAYLALNASLNELFLHAFQPTQSAIEFTSAEEHPWVENYIDDSELHRSFGDNTLYRRTTGFAGELAFNVSIDINNPPNVLVIGVESFRFRDSRYLVGDEDPSNLFKGTNMTITPNFDRWAKRGVALRNIWSSIPTSRSLESILFGQIPYNSNVRSGITGGKKDTVLSGLPQLFKEKKYETYFTTGSSITLDNWNVFLPTHGYDTVWDDRKMTRLAERDLNITADQWHGSEHRGFGWGVHDDLSFQLLGDLIVNKTKKHKEQTVNNGTRTPLFLTHYTISSHEPYDSWPRWYSESEKPDFSALYQGEQHADRIKNYLEVRHFTDMELGKFMDRMSKEGILNDTIVVIIGDHGQAPEINNANIHEESVTRVAAAIIAEGRLGDAVGLVIDDTAEQYDILNTLADITG
ncbi:unnamed protein product [Phytophthora fragariaefolia]|uniref:Unnamed protein product n=1 Tax=Phytophthora fragariaefolia TaxID=1490495 RepID=A0A9W6XRC4_9STRA|nr:unnamed protein product [Phytophthora fragariaefolia]